MKNIKFPVINYIIYYWKNLFSKKCRFRIKPFIFDSFFISQLLYITLRYYRWLSIALFIFLIQNNEITYMDDLLYLFCLLLHLYIIFFFCKKYYFSIKPSIVDSFFLSQLLCSAPRYHRQQLPLISHRSYQLITIIYGHTHTHTHHRGR